MLKKILLTLFVAIFISFIAWYHNYAQINLNQHIAKSEETMMQTDSIRFSYKVVVLLQKSYISMEQFLDTRDEDRYYDALDFIQASQGFLNIGYVQNDKLINTVNPILQKIYDEVEYYGFKISKDDLKIIYKDISFIEKQMHLSEKDIWIDFQKNYIEFQVNEHKLDMVYKYIILFISILLFVFVWVFIKQKRLNTKIIEHEKELETLAYYDTLTKIANRKSIENIIQKRIISSNRKQKGFYVALIDLDDFKKVNDIYGHGTGDELLKECVKRLKQNIRMVDDIGRFGGDEFVIVFDEVTNYDELATIFKRVSDSFKEAIKIGNNIHYTNISIGISNYPHDAKNVSDLIKYADIAMYHSKSQGKAQYNFFESELSVKIQRQVELEPQIKEALNKNEFELYYQPQIDPKTDSVVSAEALIRWNHPQKGFIPPSEFIDIIEKGYMVKEVGEWVIQKASHQQKLWKEKGIDISISVNLSVKHIMSHTFYQDIMQLISKLDIDLSKFSFEITEYELLGYKDRSVKVLNQLVKDGLNFHLDDFGTGYSSITYLNDVKIESIKIDKSFIDKIGDDGDAHFVDAIVNMAKALDIKIIAEGVECEEQLNYLKGLECDIIQGYYYSKPLCVSDFENFLSKTTLL